MSVLDTLITDRTEEDVSRLLYLKERIRSGKASEEEENEFLDGDLKGAYNASDLNRVGAAVSYVAGNLRAFPVRIETYRRENGVEKSDDITPPYDPAAISVTAKQDWSGGDAPDMPAPEQMNEYLRDISTVRAQIPLPDGTPEAPETIVGFTFAEANDVESVLLAVDAALTDMENDFRDKIDERSKGFVRSGEAFSGEF